MSVFDILVLILLCLAGYKGIKNGLFVEFASFISLFLGIFIAVKMSVFTQNLLTDYFSLHSKQVTIIAFCTTFLGVLVSIHLLAKIFTKVAEITNLNWINKLGGMIFSLLKTILALSILLNLFDKININYCIIKQETINKSIVYSPVQGISKFIYQDFQDKVKEKTNLEKQILP